MKPFCGCFNKRGKDEFYSRNKNTLMGFLKIIVYKFWYECNNQSFQFSLNGNFYFVAIFLMSHLFWQTLKLQVLPFKFNEKSMLRSVNIFFKSLELVYYDSVKWN